jgi:hypothetical protein
LFWALALKQLSHSAKLAQNTPLLSKAKYLFIFMVF